MKDAWTGRRRRARLASIPAGMALALAGAGCDLMEPDAVSDPPGDLAEARALWVAAGIDTYELRVALACYCAGAGDVVVSVQDGMRVATVDESTGDPVPTSLVHLFPTVPDLFDVVQGALDADVLRVVYHPTLGYPTEIWIDRTRRADDDEVRYDAELSLPAPPASP